MDSTPLQRRWRFFPSRLSIRAMMVLIMLIGGGFWWVVKDANDQREAVRMIVRLGGFVSYDFQQVGPGRLWDFNLKQPAPGFLQRVLPKEFFQEVTLVNLKGSSIGDEELDQIGRLKRLEYLDLGNCKVTDAGLARIRGLRNLKFLCLDGTQVTDAGLVHLKEMTNLQHLILDRTAISDAGLSHLGSHRLMSYGFTETLVTPNGTEELKRTMARNRTPSK